MVRYGTAASIAALAVTILATLPRPQLALAPPTWTPPPVAAGALHVHTARSDGTGTIDEVARAAARAGLKFVVLTDHGDGTRPPEPPAYRHGVLCLDGVEISTNDGHYLALDLPAAPYPLGGDAVAVIEDVARLGGFGIVAHPASPKADLRWRAWHVPIDAIEWLNADSEWRDEPIGRLLWAFAHYPFRPAESIAALLDRPELGLARWDALTRRRPVVGVAGVDAHARLSAPVGPKVLRDRPLLKVPSYEQAFRTFAVRVELAAPLTGRAADDARAILAALRAGRVYTAVDALATPPAFEFFAATPQQGIVRMGGVVKTVSPGRLTLTARAVLPPDGRLVLLRDGREIHSTTTSPLVYATSAERAVYRVEVRLANAPGAPPIPWLVSNPIYVGLPTELVPPRTPARTRRALFLDDPVTTGWTVERDADSRAAVDATPALSGRELAFAVALARGGAHPPFAALARASLGDIRRFDRVSFRARASQPLRLSVQLRVAEAGGFARWQRSVYVGREMREVSAFFDEMMPLGRTAHRRPDLAAADALLFVVDTTNTRPGTSAVVWFDDVRLEGQEPPESPPPPRPAAGASVASTR